MREFGVVLPFLAPSDRFSFFYTMEIDDWLTSLTSDLPLVDSIPAGCIPITTVWRNGSTDRIQGWFQGRIKSVAVLMGADGLNRVIVRQADFLGLDRLKPPGSLSAREAAEAMGLPECKVYLLRATGALLGEKRGRYVHFWPEEIEAFKQNYATCTELGREFDLNFAQVSHYLRAAGLSKTHVKGCVPFYPRQASRAALKDRLRFERAPDQQD